MNCWYRGILTLLLFLQSCLATAEITRFEELKAADEHLQQLVGSHDLKGFASDVSDPVDAPEGKRYPVTIDFQFFGHENVLPLIEALESFEEQDTAFRIFSVVVSQTAESRASDGKPVLSCSMVAAVTKGPKAPNLPRFRPDVMKPLLTQGSFDPGIARRAIVEGVDLWLTNLRHGHTDSNAPMYHVTGYAFRIPKITEFAKLLASSGRRSEAAVVSITSDQVSGFPVFRFELRVTEDNDRPLPAHALSIYDLIDAAVAPTNGRVAEIRTAPAIKVQDKFGLPLSVSVENLVSDEWPPVKKALTELKGDNVTLAGTSDKGTGGKGFTLRLKVLVEP